MSNTRVHVSLSTPNLDEAVAFYTKLFNAPPTKVKDDYANFRLDEPGLHLALVKTTEPAPRAPYEHFGIEVFTNEALGAWRARIESAGLPRRLEEDTVCCYAKADKFWVLDPDGRQWEVWLRKSEADAMSEPVAANETPCCAS